MADPCPVTGLTRAEKDAVRASWAVIWKDWKTVGCDYFIELFKAYPASKVFFKTFDNMEMAEIRASKKLLAHIINFGKGLDSFIENLDEPEVLVILIEKLSGNHHRRKIPVERFEEAFDLFVNMAQDLTKYDDFTKASWVKTLKVVADVIGNTMKGLENSGGD